jgi:hypothetical protein
VSHGPFANSLNQRAFLPSFSYNICTSFSSNPDFVFSTGFNINSTTRAQNLVFGRSVVRVRDSKLTSQNHYSGKPRVGMRIIMCISSLVSCEFVDIRWQSYGSSVQVMTRLNPRDLTSFSASSWALEAIVEERFAKVILG